MREVRITGIVIEQTVMVPDNANGAEIKQYAIKAGVPISESWQLQGHNANGSNTIINDHDVPWQDTFSVFEVHHRPTIR